MFPADRPSLASVPLSSEKIAVSHIKKQPLKYLGNNLYSVGKTLSADRLKSLDRQSFKADALRLSYDCALGSLLNTQLQLSDRMIARLLQVVSLLYFNISSQGQQYRITV